MNQLYFKIRTWSQCHQVEEYGDIPSFTIWTWSTGSALLACGLNVANIMGAITIGNVLFISYTCFNSGPGEKFHIGYTVCQRMIFGIYGSGIGILIRVVLSIVFYGSQSWLGGQAMVVIFSSFSKNYMDMEDTFPSSLAMTSRDFIGFVVFQILSMFFFLMKPEKMNKYVNFACSITGVAFVAILIACLKKNGGSPGPLWSQKSTLSGSQTAWMWIYTMSIWFGGLSPNVTNQSDFSRFSSSKTKMYLGIIVSIFVGGTFVPLAGIVAASATEELYGEALWLPTDISLRWMADNYSSGCRAANFFLGFCFAASQLTFNVLANGFSGGMDLAGVWPTYINIRRGSTITALLSWAVQPWNFYNTSSVFISVLGSFGVFVTPIVAIIVADYHFVRRAKIPLSDLYSLESSGTFYFTKGFNFRAIIVWLVSCIPGIPGLIKSVRPEFKIPVGLTNFYYGNIFFEFICPLILYVIVCLIFPVKNAGMVDKVDVFNAFTLEECEKLGILPNDTIESVEVSDIEIISEGKVSPTVKQFSV
ncbi:thiamine transporter Thi72p [[Candida] railenensis]|uniref:Thiamine transporter Thi72p n=1 Tax=[Candida] railenensis TaxID=45579 RepID=A0A9P0QTS3_9ASCO|nr:thiamine transporter Thi72p [[Candida] railenensis]